MTASEMDNESKLNRLLGKVVTVLWEDTTYTGILGKTDTTYDPENGQDEIHTRIFSIDDKLSFCWQHVVSFDTDFLFCPGIEISYLN